ncbi:MAG: ribonuclease D [Xanthomonadaceae bacterium]|nr:ribonuclease D [Xanthomonadaceae bacterium]
MNKNNNERLELIDNPNLVPGIAKKLAESEWISFDTEFIRESTFFSKLEILQIADESQTWLFDVPKLGASGLKPIFELFQNPKILKIVHAAQGDQEALFTSFGIVATPILDTALAGSLCGYGESVGLANLLRSELGVEIKKGHARTHWGTRPLAPQLLEYAASDVTDLVRLARGLKEKLDKKGRFNWALELSRKFENVSLYKPQPDELALKVAKGTRIDQKSFQALVELLRWRETRVRALDRPRKWVADDGIIYDLSIAQPKTMDHLSAFRGIAKPEVSQSGKQILEAIQKGLAGDPKDYPERERVKPPTESESRVLELTKVFLGHLSDKNGISVNHMVTQPSLLQILRNPNQSLEEWVKEEWITAGAVEIMGNELKSFLSGQVGIFVDGLSIQFEKR